MQAPRPAALLLQLSVQFASSTHRSALPRHKLQRWVRAALRCGPADTRLRKSGSAPIEPARITLRIVDAAEGRELNRTYRGKDYATNVLTFDDQPWPPAADIVLCDAVIAREAAEQGKDLAAHCAHMVVHGVLHAMGWDHEQDADAERMEAAERALLLTLGIADPYA